jgi:fibro-slime domain-containing protein
MQFDYGAPQPLDITGGVADKSTNGWFPYNLWATRKVDGVDKTGYGTLDPEQYDNKNMDYHFGMRADLPFSMTANGRVKSTDDNSEEIIFHFSGDDDVWIYIDGQQVVDLGGMHNRLDIEIDFAANTVTYSEHTKADTNNTTGSYNDPENWKAVRKLFKENADDNDSLLPYTRKQFAANEKHELQFFYLERGRGTSNCRVEFNLPMTDTLSVTKVANESWSQRQDDEDLDDHDGTYPLSDKEQAAVNEIDFGFTLYKQVAGSDSFEPVKNTNYYLLDDKGNSMAGIEALRRLSQRLYLSIF